MTERIQDMQRLYHVQCLRIREESHAVSSIKVIPAPPKSWSATKARTKGGLAPTVVPSPERGVQEVT